MRRIFKTVIAMTLQFSGPHAGEQSLFVANNADNTISIVSRDVVTCFPVASGPREIVSYGDKLIVAECDNHTVGLYSPDDLSPIARIHLPDEPRAITVTPAGVLAVLKNQARLLLLNIPESNFTELGMTSAGPRSIAQAPDNTQVFISCNSDHCVDVFSTADWRKLSSFKTAKNPYALCITPEHILVTSIGENCVQAYSRKNFELSWISRDTRHPTAIRMAPGNKLLATSFDDHQLIVLNASTGEIINRIQTRKEPFGLDVTEDCVVVSSHGENYVQVFDSDSLLLIKEFPVGTKPHGVTCSIRKKVLS